MGNELGSRRGSLLCKTLTVRTLGSRRQEKTVQESGKEMFKGGMESGVGGSTFG